MSWKIFFFSHICLVPAKAKPNGRIRYARNQGGVNGTCRKAKRKHQGTPIPIAIPTAFNDTGAGRDKS